MTRKSDQATSSASMGVAHFEFFLCIMVCCLVVLPLFDHPKASDFGRIGGDQWWYLVYLQNFSIANASAFRHGILDVTWSLAIEEQFYLVWPFVVMFLGRRGLMRTCLGLLILTSVLRFIFLENGCVSPLGVYVLTPTRLDGLLIGAFLAIAWRHSHIWIRVTTWRPFVLAASFGACGLYWYFTDESSWDHIVCSVMVLWVFFV